jgi:hypothetical protein
LPMIETEFLPTGEFISKTKYTYDPDGFIKETVWINNNEFIIRKSTFEKDINSKSFIERIYQNPDSVESKTIYFYTDLDSGVVKEVWSYKGELNLLYRKIVNHDSEHKITQEEYRDGNGMITYSLLYNYDTNGYPQDVVQLFPNGIKIKKIDFKYTAAGLIAGEIDYNQSGSMMLYRKYSYDD